MNKYNSNSDWLNPLNAGVTADLDPPPQIWTPRSRSASGFGPPGPDPLADLDPPVQIR